MTDWKTLNTRAVYASGRWLSVEERTVQTPDGQIIEHWPWVITPDYVNVLAVTPEGKYLIFRQGKYALEGQSLAPIGGYVDEGEDPLSAAKRELLEETGYTADDWRHLGCYWVDPNRGVAQGNLYLARGARQVAERSADDLEEQHLLFMERGELVEALRSGQFKVLAWAATIAFALLCCEDDKSI